MGVVVEHWSNLASTFKLMFRREVIARRTKSPFRCLQRARRPAEVSPEILILKPAAKVNDEE